MATVNGASKAMQAAGLGEEAHKLAWSITDALVIGEGVASRKPSGTRRAVTVPP